MTGYTKLFGSIIASTIWREDKETKIVWITMLAMANKHGVVEASIPGLADMARVTLREVQGALAKLSAPDEFSRTRDHDGRRIKEIDGGWLILNHAKYREKMNADERRDYLAEKKRESRERGRDVNAESTNVNSGQPESASSTQSEASPKALTPPGFEEFWQAYPKKIGKPAAIRAFKTAKAEKSLPLILKDIATRKNGDQWKKSAGQFIPYPATYLNQKRWEDQHETSSFSPRSRNGAVGTANERVIDQY